MLHLNRAFPLIRHVSKRCTPWLIKIPLSPNQITLTSMFLGIISGLLLVWGNYIANIASCMFFFLSYLLDNCDGEVARARDQTSIFGYYLDSFVDWIVHAVFFLCLGFGEYTRSDEILWLGFGVAASLGATINYGIRVYLDFINGRNKHLPVETNINQQKDLQSASWNEKIAFIFRELARADFWLIFFIFVFFDITWFLLAASSIGSQIYWMTNLYTRKKNYHV